MRRRNERKAARAIAAFLLAAGAVLLIGGCRGDRVGVVVEHDASAVVVYVNGEAVRYGDFQARVRQSTAGTETPAEDPLSRLNERVAVLNGIVDRMLVAQEAKRRGIAVEREELEHAVESIRSEQDEQAFARALAEEGLTPEAWTERLAEMLLEEKVTKEVILPGIEIGEPVLQDYYRTHPGEFEQTLQVHGWQIVVATKAEADDVLARLREGAEFEILAQEVSIAPERSRGGDLGWFGKGQMPTEFDEVFFDLPVGELSAVVKTQYGYHLFRVTERREPKVFTFEEAREEIEAIVRHQRLDDAYRKWIAGLRDAADISINETLLGAER